MRYHRDDIVDRAVDLLDQVGLEALSMRRLAAELGVQPSALYHHFQGKQELLGAVADAILDRGRRPTEVVTWQAELMLVCVELRDIMLRHRDGAALVALVHSLGIGAEEPLRRMASALRWAHADDELARVGARTLFHYVFGHVAGEQAQGEQPQGEQAEAERWSAEADFARGLGVILDGLTAQMGRVGAVS